MEMAAARMDALQNVRISKKARSQNVREGGKNTMYLITNKKKYDCRRWKGASKDFLKCVAPLF